MPDKARESAEVLESALQKLQLTDVQRELLKIQWLDSLAFMDRHAQRNWTLHVVLRLIAILGAVFVPAFVAITPSPDWARAIRIATFTLSLCVALATALESFFRSGDRWQHYRRNTEALRLDGMQFLMLSGPYAKFATHQDAFHEFAARLNAILSTEVEAYFTQVAVEKPSDEQHREVISGQQRSGV
jgi:uncharacterized protein DUF4231